MAKKGNRQYTIFWIHPLKGQLKKIHLRWQTVLLGLFLVLLGTGLGVGGVLWYQNRIKNELFLASNQLKTLQNELFTYDVRKQEQETKLEELSKQAEEVLREIHTMRELDRKVRELLEEDLQSGLQKLGVDISLSSTPSEMYIPLNRFTEIGYGGTHFGSGGPTLFINPLPESVSPLRSASDPAFATRAKHLEDTFDWIRAESMVREKSYREILEVADQRDRMATLVPLRWPTWGRVSSGYGWRNDPFTGRRAWHTGVDIAAPSGRNVVATAEGRVAFAGWNGNYGNTVIIRHQFGFETVYAHLSQIRVKTGDTVRKEQVIGNIGSTGRSTGPHLHYEVRRYGNVINPWPYLP